MTMAKKTRKGLTPVKGLTSVRSKSKPAAPALGDTMEVLINQIAVDKAAEKERVDQEHLTRRAWQLYGNLIYFQGLTPPDRAHFEVPFDQEESSKRAMAERILDDIGGIVLSFANMGFYGPDADEEF
jgi:hypothetical protein